jgi:hypothetical protein
MVMERLGAGRSNDDRGHGWFDWLCWVVIDDEMVVIEIRHGFGFCFGEEVEENPMVEG